MTLVYQTVKLENDCEALVQARVSVEKSDFVGVPDYPVYSDEDFANKTIQLFGVDVAIKDLPENVVNAFWDWCYEAIDDAAWED